MRILKMLGFIGLFMGIWFLAQLIAAIIVAVPMLIISVMQGIEPSVENLIVSGLSWILILSSLLATLLFWVVSLLRGKRFFKELRLRSLTQEHIVHAILSGLGISLMLNGIINLANVERYFPEASQELAEMFVGSDILSLLLAVGIVVPIFEELMFRGLIFNEMRRALPPWAAIVLSGILFGVAHMNPIQVMYTVPMGILLAILYYKTGSLWAPILIHMAWNICSVLLGVIIPAPTMPIYLLITGAGLALLIYSAWQLFSSNSAQDLDLEETPVDPAQPPIQPPQQPPTQPPNLVL